jgi:hypothetical protein
MNSYGEGSALGLVSQSITSTRRDAFIVPCLTAIIVLALGLVLVSVTCRTAPEEGTPAQQTTATQVR